jgi:hypothetical protein
MLDASREVVSWEAYVMSMAGRLYDLEQQVKDGCYGDPPFGSDGTADRLSDPDEAEEADE